MCVCHCKSPAHFNLCVIRCHGHCCIISVQPHDQRRKNSCWNKELLKKREDERDVRDARPDWLSICVATTMKFGKVTSDVVPPGWKLLLCSSFVVVFGIKHNYLATAAAAAAARCDTAECAERQRQIASPSALYHLARDNGSANLRSVSRLITCRISLGTLGFAAVGFTSSSLPATQSLSQPPQHSLEQHVKKKNKLSSQAMHIEIKL